MFRIADGREHFYQWDVDRQIIVEDSSITEVHFCNRTDDCSLVVEVIDGLANVPNVILQKSFDIRVFGFDGKATRYDEAFKVKARTKPTDYVYTEVEIKRYEDLSKRIDEIEEKGFSEEVIDNAVNDYFEKNPIDFTGYATEAYVDNAIANINECDTYFFNPIAYEWSTNAIVNPNYAPDNLIEFAQRFLAGEGVNLCIAENFNDAVRWLPGDFYKLQGGVGFNRSIFWNDVGKEAELTTYYVRESSKGWIISKYTTVVFSIADRQYVDDAIAAIEIPEGGGTYYLDFKNATEELQPATEDMIEFATRYLEGQNVCAYVMTNQAGNAVKGYQPVTVQKVLNKLSITTTGLDPANAAASNTIKYFKYYLYNDSTAGWVYCINNTYSFALATKEYVDDAIANIDIPEGTGGGEVIYRLVKPDSEPTEEPSDGNKVQITDAHTIEYLNRAFAGEAVLAYTWRIGLNRFLITEVVKAQSRITLRAHRLTLSSIYNYIFYMDIGDDGNWYWSGYHTDEYDIQRATEQTVQTALNNIGVAEGGSY